MDAKDAHVHQDSGTEGGHIENASIFSLAVHMSTRITRLLENLVYSWWDI